MRNFVNNYVAWRDEVGMSRVRDDIHRFFRDVPNEDLIAFMENSAAIENHLYKTPKAELEHAVTRYMDEVLHNQDAPWSERIFSGVLAFIHTIEWGQPYPLVQYGFEEKKWWQFWK